MEKLTLQKLKDLPGGAVIGRGIVENSPEGVYMTDDRLGDKLRWVAVRGSGFHDWAIYLYWEDRDEEWIKQHGEKTSNEESIKKLVPCDEEAYKMYRR